MKKPAWFHLEKKLAAARKQHFDKVYLLFYSCLLIKTMPVNPLKIFLYFQLLSSLA